MRVRKDDIYRCAHLYVPAQPDIVRYAHRLRDDIPQDYQVFELVRSNNGVDFPIQENYWSNAQPSDVDQGGTLVEFERNLLIDQQIDNGNNSLLNDFLTNLCIEGRFQQYSIST
jgi:hypothetical protein